MLSPQAHVIISQFLNVRVASTTQRCQRPFRCSEGDRIRQISNKERSAAEGDRTRSQRHAHVTHCTYKSWTSSVGFLCQNLYVAGSSNVTPVRPLQKNAATVSQAPANHHCHSKPFPGHRTLINHELTRLVAKRDKQFFMSNQEHKRRVGWSLVVSGARGWSFVVGCTMAAIE